MPPTKEAGQCNGMVPRIGAVAGQHVSMVGGSGGPPHVVQGVESLANKKEGQGATRTRQGVSLYLIHAYAPYSVAC